MELAEPAHSNLDVHFRIGRIPGRVHWSFWLFTTLLGVVDPHASVVSVSLWIAAVFISIVVHELGHALAARAYGMAPRIVLYGMGGLAVFRPVRKSWISRVLIAAAGPGAGFLLAGLVVALGVALGYSVRLDPLNFRVGDGEVNPKTFELTRAGEVFPITPKELRLLQHFYQHRGEVLSREHLLNKVWGVNSANNIFIMR